MSQVGVQTWSGRSDEIAVPMLGAEFWKDGTEVSGVLDGVREQKVGGVAYRVVLDVPVVVDGEEEGVVEIPTLAGIKYAMLALRSKGYQHRKGDLWRVTCTGVRKARKEGYSDSPEFDISVIRKAAA